MNKAPTTKQAIMTIDVEGHSGTDPIRRLIWGETADGSCHGIDRMMDIGDSYGVRFLFFVDIAAAFEYGKEKIAQVLLHIKSRGHDIGVHVHASHMGDKSRDYMWQYSIEEQRDILKKCTAFYTEVLGMPPTSFRAGSYGANRDTLQVLEELGYQYDFSQHYGKRACAILPPAAYTSPAWVGKLIEVPVTVYRSIKLGRLTRYDKIDSGQPISSNRRAMKRISKHKGYSVVSLFFHSFSMLHWRENPNSPVHNEKNERKFLKSLEYIATSDAYTLCSLADLQKPPVGAPMENASDIVAISNPLEMIWDQFLLALMLQRTNKKARLLVYSAFAISAVLLGILLWLLW